MADRAKGTQRCGFPQRQAGAYHHVCAVSNVALCRTRPSHRIKQNRCAAPSTSSCDFVNSNLFVVSACEAKSAGWRRGELPKWRGSWYLRPASRLAEACYGFCRRRLARERGREAGVMAATAVGILVGKTNSSAWREWKEMTQHRLLKGDASCASLKMQTQSSYRAPAWRQPSAAWQLRRWHVVSITIDATSDLLRHSLTHRPPEKAAEMPDCSAKANASR